MSRYRYIVRPYLRLATGPGRPRTVRGILRDLWKDRFLPHKWFSVYSNGSVLDSGWHREIALAHYRWGPVIWGLDLGRKVEVKE
ncbi:MAG: hypothetical protein ABL912_02035 [Novosphingobium sp.]